MGFAETVAVNRGLPIAMFATVEQARAWLVQSVAADQPPAGR